MCIRDSHQGHALTALRPGTKPRIAVVDYGMGNLASVAKALERSGADVRVTESAAAVRDAAAVVLPGVGAFRDAAARLEQSGLGAAVLERIAAGTPFLGVCLGLQLLFCLLIHISEPTRLGMISYAVFCLK